MFGLQYDMKRSVLQFLTRCNIKWPKHKRGEYSLYFVQTTPTYSKQYNRTGVQNLSACIRNIVESVKCRMK